MMNFLYKISKYGKVTSANEVMLKTETGTIRTLWYGFEDETIKPVYFDMHGGGFILMSADADDTMNTSILKTVGCKVISIDYSLAPEHPLLSKNGRDNKIPLRYHKIGVFAFSPAHTHIITDFQRRFRVYFTGQK